MTKKILVLGGGFAGLYTVIELDNNLARTPGRGGDSGKTVRTSSCSHPCCMKSQRAILISLRSSTPSGRCSNE